MIRMPDRQLRIVAPLVAVQARETPNPLLDELLGELVAVATRRGLRSLLVDLERIAGGGALELPQPRDGMPRDLAAAV